MTTKPRVVADHERIVTRMADELDAMIKMASWARECLFNELTDGLGYKKMGISDKGVKKMAEVAKMMETLTGAKIRFDKAAKAMADTMSPKEEMDAVIAYLKSVEPQVRSDILTNIKNWQDRASNAAAS